MVELHAVLHELVLPLVDVAESEALRVVHLVLQLVEEVQGEALLEGEDPLGWTDGEVRPMGLALADVPGHPHEALPELGSGLTPGGVGHRPVERLPLLRPDAPEPGVDPAVQLEATGVAELPHPLCHAVGPGAHQGIGELLGGLGARPAR